MAAALLVQEEVEVGDELPSWKADVSPVEAESTAHLTEVQRQELDQLLSEFQDVLSDVCSSCQITPLPTTSLDEGDSPARNQGDVDTQNYRTFKERMVFACDPYKCLRKMVLSGYASTSES